MSKRHKRRRATLHMSKKLDRIADSLGQSSETVTISGAEVHEMALNETRRAMEETYEAGAAAFAHLARKERPVIAG